MKTLVLFAWSSGALEPLCSAVATGELLAKLALVVVPPERREELPYADACLTPSLTLYELEGWERPLEEARPDLVVTVGIPGELEAALRLTGSRVVTLPESNGLVDKVRQELA